MFRLLRCVWQERTMDELDEYVMMLETHRIKVKLEDEHE